MFTASQAYAYDLWKTSHPWEDLPDEDIAFERFNAGLLKSEMIEHFWEELFNVYSQPFSRVETVINSAIANNSTLINELGYDMSIWDDTVCFPADIGADVVGSFCDDERLRTFVEAEVDKHWDDLCICEDIGESMWQQHKRLNNID